MSTRKSSNENAMQVRAEFPYFHILIFLIRATTCKHLQCFDAATFLYMNEKKSSWKCPVCDQPALFEHLTIDGYFLNVINSQKLGSDDEIQLHKDGSWSSFSFAVKDEKKEMSHKEDAQKESIEIISDGEAKNDNFFMQILIN